MVSLILLHMKSFLLSLLLFALVSPLRAADPHPLTQTFYVSGVKNEGDVAAIKESLKQVKSVTKVDGLTAESGWANVSFDSHADSYQQVAQAIADAKSSGGTPFSVTMKVRVPDYAKDDNAAKVDAIFAKHQANVKVETVDREKGEFVIHFLPLNLDAKRQGPQGWSGGHFGHAIHDAPPKGLGLDMILVREGVSKPAPKK